MVHSKQTLFYYFLLSLILGSGLHFLYTLIPSPFTAVIAPISESIWEHTKIIYFPYLLLALLYNRRHSPSTIGSFLLALPVMCFSMLTIGSIYHIVLDFHALWFDLLLFFLVMAFGFWFPAHCSIPSHTPLWYLGITLTILLGILIFVFTFFSSCSTSVSGFILCEQVTPFPFFPLFAILMHKSYLQVAEWGNIMFLYGLSSLTHRRDAYALLQTALHQIYGLSELPELKQQERGKPYFPQYPSIHFNLSHSGSFALCGISDQPIGVDIQVLRPFRPTLMKRSCSDHELAWLHSRGMQESDFALLWTLKESIGKYTGYGLPYPPSRLLVPTPPLGEPFSTDATYPYQNLLCRVYTEPTWCAAVCSSQTPSKEIVWI